MHFIKNKLTLAIGAAVRSRLRGENNLALKKKKCTDEFGWLTFGMIPHITQERRAEDNIHHTGRMEGLWSTQKRCEQRSGPATPSLITRVSPDFGGQRDEDAGSHTRAAPASWRQRATSPITRVLAPTGSHTKINTQIKGLFGREVRECSWSCVFGFFK